MIYNQWYAVMESKEVKKGKATGVTRFGEKLVLWRDKDGKPVCQMDRCAHRGVMLSAGVLKNHHIQCPFHGLEYDETGKCTVIPANGKNAPVPPYFEVLTYPSQDAHGFIWVFWGDRRENLPPLPFFEDIDESFSYGTYSDHWSVQYSRAIENQLDVVHVPFVHQSSIGRGNRTLINGPRTSVSPDGLSIWVYNVLDEGQKPLKPEETPEPKKDQQHLHFKFPATWQNFITPKLRITICFAPIDEENCKLYIRFYQSFIKIPLLKQFVNWAGCRLNSWIAGQDKRVVITQQPKKTALKMNEKLFQGDHPIVSYRKGRDELQKAGGTPEGK